MSPLEAATGRIAAWRSDAVLFVREVLGAEPDNWQVEVLRAAVARQRVALKASKGPGKTTILAWLGWWFLACFLDAKVVATSISRDNLKDNLWAELAKWQRRSELLKRAFTWHAERIVQVDRPETWWASARAWPKEADSSKQAETLAGVHGDFVLGLIDEVGGIPDAVVATAEGMLANADDEQGRVAKLVMAGNPTQTSGPLYRACTRERALWWVKEISGDPDDPNRAPRVSVQWAREQIEKFGADNPWVLVNVFGQFPPGQSNTLIAVDVASAAAARTLEESEWMHAAKVLGVDVARFGDDRIVKFLRQGRVAFKPTVARNFDLMQTSHWVAWTVDRHRPDGLFVDATGMGAGVVDRLRELGYAVDGIEAASRPIGGDPKEPRFANRRAEMWWRMGEWLKTACIPDDPELIGELTAPTYRYDLSGRLLLESKDDLKKRGLPSPDKADALALTFAAPVAAKTAEAFAAAEVQRKRLHVSEYDPFERRE